MHQKLEYSSVTCAPANLIPVSCYFYHINVVLSAVFVLRIMMLVNNNNKKWEAHAAPLPTALNSLIEHTNASINQAELAL